MWEESIMLGCSAQVGASTPLSLPPPSRWNPSAYTHIAPHHQHIEARKLLNLHVQELSGRERVLDVGCGDGSFTATGIYPLIALRGSVVGIDRDPAMIDHASTAYSQKGSRANLRFIEANVLDLSHVEGEFDLVFSNAALHHLYREEQQRAALGEIRSRMTRGSVLLASLAGHGNFQGLIESCERVIALPTWSPFFEGFSYPLLRPTPNQYRAPLLDNNLCPVALYLDTHVHYHASAQELEDFVRVCLRSVMCRLEGMSEESQRGFASQVVTEYLKSSQWSQTARGIALRSVNLIVKAIAT